VSTFSPFAAVSRPNCLFVGLIVCCAAAVLGQEIEVRRARPPKWDRVPTGVFFKDAFTEGLRGERPASLNRRGAPDTPSAAAITPGASSSAAVASADWSRLISAATLEDELKAIQRRMELAVANEGQFKAQGFAELRPHLGTAAIVFAIIEQFDRPVRWQQDAATARDRFSRVAQNAKAGSSQVVREVQQRQQDLMDLIRGSRLAGSGGQTPMVWPDVADRKLIMQRTDQSMQQTLAPAVASDAQWRKQKSDVFRESELVAALSFALQQAEMPDASDSQYDELSERLQRAALDLRTSVQQDDRDAARRALGEMKNSCIACHEIFRS
jgi:hypothetical protein